MKGFRHTLMICIIVDMLMVALEYKEGFTVAYWTAYGINIIMISLLIVKIQNYLSTIAFQPLLFGLFLYKPYSLVALKISLLTLWVCTQMYQVIYYYYNNGTNRELNFRERVEVLIDDINNARELSTQILMAHVASKDEIKVDESDETCSICLEDLLLYITLPCGHFLHKKCLLDLLNRNILKCPLCQREIVL